MSFTEFYRQKYLVLISILSMLGLSFAQTVPERESLFLTMDDAINRALSHNNQYRASKYASKMADWQSTQAWTQMFPKLTFNTRFTWIDDSTFALRDFSRYFQDGPTIPGLPEFNIPQTVFQESFFTSFDAEMTVFNWQILNGLFLSDKAQDAADQQRRSTRDQVIFQAISSYLNVLYARDVLNLQREYLDLSLLNYEKAERMHEAGRYSRMEALRWKVDYQQQKSIVETSESSLRSAMVMLKRVLNIKMLNKVEVESSVPQSFITEAERVKVMPLEKILQLIELDDAELAEANAALAAAKLNTEVSQLTYRGTMAVHMPTVSMSYQYAWRENNTVNLDDYNPQLFMVNFSLPIFSSFQDHSTRKAAYYDHKKNEELYIDQIQNTRLVLTETINKIINLRTQIELSKTNVEYNEHNYRIVEQQKEKGLVSNIDFIDAKLNLQDAKLTEVKNQYDFVAAIIETYYLIGRIDELIPNQNTN